MPPESSRQVCGIEPIGSGRLPLPPSGLTHLKIKLNRDDPAWDVERAVRVDRGAAETQACRPLRHFNARSAFVLATFQDTAPVCTPLRRAGKAARLENERWNVALRSSPPIPPASPPSKPTPALPRRVPAANKPWESRFPDIFHITDATMDTLPSPPRPERSVTAGLRPAQKSELKRQKSKGK